MAFKFQRFASLKVTPQIQSPKFPRPVFQQGENWPGGNPRGDGSIAAGAAEPGGGPGEEPS